MQIHALLWMGTYCFELLTSVFIVALDTPTHLAAFSF